MPPLANTLFFGPTNLPPILSVWSLNLILPLGSRGWSVAWAQPGKALCHLASVEFIEGQNPMAWFKIEVFLICLGWEIIKFKPRITSGLLSHHYSGKISLKIKPKHSRTELEDGERTSPGENIWATWTSQAWNQHISWTLRWNGPLNPQDFNHLTTNCNLRVYPFSPLFWNSASLLFFHISMSSWLEFSRKILTGRCSVQCLYNFSQSNHASRQKKITFEIRSL